MTRHPWAISLDSPSSIPNHTGSWRTERPVYVDLLPPCNQACPAGENIQQWLYHAESGNYHEAWLQILVDNPLPATSGRVCFHPCRTACNRGQLDEPVGINSIERFLGDEAIHHGWTAGSPPSSTGHRVLVVGAGPAGLSAAHHLRRLGHDVVLADGAPLAGGMLRYGIPAYRLPRAILDAEVERILAMGVDFRSSERINDLDDTMRAAGCTAAFIGVGAQRAKSIDIPVGDTTTVIDALGLLRSVATGSPVALGRKVAVYGGGDTALDAARTAMRLTDTDPILIYRRSPAQMPGDAAELAAAEAEGVRARWLTTIAGSGANGLQVERMRLDASSRPVPTGEYDSIDADTVVLALGQDTDLSLVNRFRDVVVRDGLLSIDPRSTMTGHPGVFAGGDAVAGSRTVTDAIGMGKRAARAIDAWLQGHDLVARSHHAVATATRLHTWYYSDAPASVAPILAAQRRRTTFAEVVGGLETETALFEARRCLSCGNCFECDNCYGFCPDDAIVKLGPGRRYAIDYDYCKGCGICAAECPCGAITMVPEVI